MDTIVLEPDARGNHHRPATPTISAAITIFHHRDPAGER